MNLIVICLDSFRQDHVSFYHQDRPVFDGVEPCATPHIDALASESVVFRNAYPANLPTMPARFELMTGQFGLPSRGWEALSPSDHTIADVLRNEGYVSALITDNYHYFRPHRRVAMNYHHGFHSFHWIRGQEYDAFHSHQSERPVDNYVTDAFSSEWRSLVSQYLVNTDGLTAETDRFGAQVVDRAIDWLTRNREHERIFCWIDSFDPHEPWDPPPSFDRYTDPAYDGPRLILPLGGPTDEWATHEEIQHVRGLYAGECAYVDAQVGRLLRALEELGYMDDSIVVLLSDHGHPLADHGKFLKSGDRLYSELLNVPFMIRVPGLQPRVTSALVQFPDLWPTILDILECSNLTESLAGRSFHSVLTGRSSEHRRTVISGYHDAPDRCIRNGSWSYIIRPDGDPDELYNLDSDPWERQNLIDERPDEARRLTEGFGSIWFRERPLRVKGIEGQYELT